LNGYMQGEWIFYLSPEGMYHSGWFNAKIYNSSSFLFPGLLYPPGAPPCSFTNAPTPCRGHGLAACYAGARRVQRRVWGLRRSDCQRTGKWGFLVRREDMFPYGIKLVKLNVAK
jgi:hypothetical protein